MQLWIQNQRMMDYAIFSIFWVFIASWSVATNFGISIICPSRVQNNNFCGLCRKCLFVVLIYGLSRKCNMWSSSIAYPISFYSYFMSFHNLVVHVAIFHGCIRGKVRDMRAILHVWAWCPK